MNSLGQQVPNMLQEISGDITPERMKRQPNQNQHPVVDVTGDGSKIQCYKSNIAQEPGLLGPWIKAN